VAGGSVSSPHRPPPAARVTPAHAIAIRHDKTVETYQTAVILRF
jgi:hypothetical protein